MRRLGSPMRALLLSITITIAIALVACARPAPSPSSAAVSTAAAQAVGSPRLVAGTSGDYPPLSIWTSDGRVSGFAPALVSAFADAQRFALDWTRFTWPALSDDLRAGRFALAADGITVRPERSIGGRFTVPIARGGAVLLWRPRAGLDGSGDAGTQLAALDRHGLRVVVNAGGHLERVARGLFHAAELRAIPDNDAVRAAFVRGDADAAMTNTFEAPGWAEGAVGVQQLGPLTQDVTAVWVRADRADVADRLDAWLLDEEESGRLAALRGRWLGAGAGPAAALPVSALLAATAERLALMPFVAAAKERTGKAVDDPAQEERVIEVSRTAAFAVAKARGTAPPPREAVDAFFRAQIEAAKAVQRRARAAPGQPAFSLEDDLRPAIARISARMAHLAVRVPRETERGAVLREARFDLASSGLDPAQIDELGASIASLAQRP